MRSPEFPVFVNAGIFVRDTNPVLVLFTPPPVEDSHLPLAALQVFGGVQPGVQVLGAVQSFVTVSHTALPMHVPHTLVGVVGVVGVPHVPRIVSEPTPGGIH